MISEYKVHKWQKLTLEERIIVNCSVVDNTTTRQGVMQLLKRLVQLKKCFKKEIMGKKNAVNHSYATDRAEMKGKSR